MVIDGLIDGDREGMLSDGDLNGVKIVPFRAVGSQGKGRYSSRHVM